MKKTQEWLNSKVISSITPFSLLDYEEYPSAIIWFGGCNMRCVYCYNPEIVLEPPTKTYQEVIDFLQTRVGLLDGVVLCGGEPTIAKDLILFLEEIVKLGFKIKLDTNGTNTTILQTAIQNNFIDYIALDFKSLGPNFENITKFKDFSKFCNSLDLLIKSNIDFEVRTTVHLDLISYENINLMTKFLEDRGYKNTYYLQEFVLSKNIGNIINNSIKIDLHKIDTKLNIVVRTI